MILRQMMMNRDASLLSFMLVLSVLCCGIACDDSATPAPPISIAITQPTDSQRVSGEVLRILTETSSECGCNAHVEFYIDGVHVYSHYQPFYFYDWSIEGLSGEHVILARLVVKDNGEVEDSVRVFIEQ